MGVGLVAGVAIVYLHPHVTAAVCLCPHVAAPPAFHAPSSPTTIYYYRPAALVPATVSTPWRTHPPSRRRGQPRSAQRTSASSTPSPTRTCRTPSRRSPSPPTPPRTSPASPLHSSYAASTTSKSATSAQSTLPPSTFSTSSCALPPPRPSPRRPTSPPRPRGHRPSPTSRRPATCAAFLSPRVSCVVVALTSGLA